MSSSDLCRLTIQETADLLASGQTTARAVTDAYLARIEALNPKLNAYLTVFEQTAREQADQSDERRRAGKTLGPLDGIPLAIKDNLAIKDQRTTAGSRLLADYAPPYSATVVKKLLQAGAVILGKTNMDEFAMGSSTENSAFGPSLNPWDTSKVPGGSSGGSAVAVAADLAAGALGSDTGGSIRQPAGFCGLVGLKPTYGLVSRYGLLAMASSLDQIGPMTKSVNDSRILLSAIAGPDPFDATARFSLPKLDSPSTDDLAGLTIGLPSEYFGEGIDEPVLGIINSALDQLVGRGAKLKIVSLPLSPMALSVYYLVSPVEVASNMARYDGIRFGQSLERQGGSHSLTAVYKQTRADFLGPEVKRRIMLGTYASSAGYYDAYYEKAMRVRRLIKEEFDQIFQQVDLLASPTSPTTAFGQGEKLTDPLAMYLADVNTVPVNLAGLPAISLPAGLIDGLPVGLQLIGPTLGEPRLFEVASAYESIANFAVNRPKPEVING